MRSPLTAITREPSSLLQSGERTFIGRSAIDSEKAAAQHAAYCDVLAQCGFAVRTIAADDSFPDCTFVEDCAVTIPQSALICRPGAESRIGEVQAVATELSQFVTVVRSQSPAKIEGGDVLRFGNRFLVGRSSRTNTDGIVALRRWAEPFGYSVTECAVHGSLHLKTACTFLPDGSLLANPKWVEIPDDVEVVEVAGDEPWAGNILLANKTVIAASSQPNTNQLIRERGFELVEVDVGEFQKAEGGVTCLSILVGI